jgi:hypothetical protein
VKNNLFFFSYPSPLPSPLGGEGKGEGVISAVKRKEGFYEEKVEGGEISKPQNIKLFD